jgi:C-terminal processing protease CtpA/Prc
MLTDSLISYISDHPFCNLEKKMIRISRPNQFKGKVYILAGSRTYSASSMFAAIAKCYTDAIIVGEKPASH